jgi:hypothetical protein
MTFVPTDVMATQDIPSSSISLSVSDATNENDLVTGASSFCNDIGNSNALSQDGAVEADEFVLRDENLFKKRKAHSITKTQTSWIWNHFKKMDDRKEFAFCQLCTKEVYYSKDYSTSMLVRHLKRHHKQVYTNYLDVQADSKVGMQQSLKPYLLDCPKFEKCLINWMIATYQPLRCCEDPSFREMCLSLSKKAPILSRERLRTLLSEEYSMTKKTLKMILKGRHYSFTTDGWTSAANVGYVTCTAHFIDTASWKVHSIVMGLYEKNGGSTADDVVDYCENQLKLFDLSYREAVAVVTDTEATMIAAGRLLVQRSLEEGGTTKWLGCIDHLLQLVTKKAFSDLPMSEGTLKACRNLVNFFNSSSQATKKLLGKQVEGRAVKVIQDVTTRWWSTYSMCDRLLRLKIYLSLLENEGDLPCNLTDSQWLIVRDLHLLLKPFMIAQRLLEGETYVTISLVPYMVYKIRKGLQQSIESPTSSEYIRSIAAEMMLVFNTHFGQGAAGTVAIENLQPGYRRRPKGINMLALMASFLDPRTKGGVGISDADQEIIYEKIRESMIEIAALEIGHAQHEHWHEQQQQQVPAPHEQINPHPAEEDDIFDEINNYYIDENANRVVNVAVENPGVNVAATVDAELTLYKQEPMLQLRKEDGTFNCPLTWWKYNERKYRLLSILASRLLCIPATSAPSERVFSVAGLTIAKDRARLASDTANELIFLHDALPGIQKYYEAERI